MTDANSGGPSPTGKYGQGGGAYWLKALLYIDIFLGSLCARDPDVTISSYAGLELRHPTGRRWLAGLGRGLNAISRNHCESAIAGDITRAVLAIRKLTDQDPTARADAVRRLQA